MNNTNTMSKQVSINPAIMYKAILANVQTIGGKKFVEIPISMLTTDIYQREPDGHERKIAAEWDDAKCTPVLVSFRDNAFYIIDGNHHTKAAQMVGKDTILCQLFEGLERNDEAKMFSQQDGNKVKVSLISKFRAMIIAEDPTSLVISEVIKSYHIELPNDEGKNPVLKALNSVIIAYNSYGEGCLHFMFSTIQKAGWHYEKNAYSKIMISALRNIYANHRDNLTEAQTSIVRTLEHVSYDILKAKACSEFIGRSDSGAITSLFEKAIQAHATLIGG